MIYIYVCVAFVDALFTRLPFSLSLSLHCCCVRLISPLSICTRYCTLFVCSFTLHCPVRTFYVVVVVDLHTFDFTHIYVPHVAFLASLVYTHARVTLHALRFAFCAFARVSLHMPFTIYAFICVCVCVYVAFARCDLSFRVTYAFARSLLSRCVYPRCVALRCYTFTAFTFTHAVSFGLSPLFSLGPRLHARCVARVGDLNLASLTPGSGCTRGSRLHIGLHAVTRILRTHTRCRARVYAFYLYLRCTRVVPRCRALRVTVTRTVTVHIGLRLPHGFCARAFGISIVCVYTFGRFYAHGCVVGYRTTHTRLHTLLVHAGYGLRWLHGSRVLCHTAHTRYRAVLAAYAAVLSGSLSHTYTVLRTFAHAVYTAHCFGSPHTLRTLFAPAYIYLAHTVLRFFWVVPYVSSFVLHVYTDRSLSLSSLSLSISRFTARTFTFCR